MTLVDDLYLVESELVEGIDARARLRVLLGTPSIQQRLEGIEREWARVRDEIDQCQADLQRAKTEQSDAVEKAREKMEKAERAYAAARAEYARVERTQNAAVNAAQMAFGERVQLRDALQRDVIDVVELPADFHPIASYIAWARDQQNQRERSKRRAAAVEALGAE